jgi:hypothetical protein
VAVVVIITRKKSHERERDAAARNHARDADESARDRGGAPCQHPHDQRLALAEDPRQSQSLPGLGAGIVGVKGGGAGPKCEERACGVAVRPARKGIVVMKRPPYLSGSAANLRTASRSPRSAALARDAFLEKKCGST